VFSAQTDPRILRGDRRVLGNYREETQAYGKGKNNTLHNSMVQSTVGASQSNPESQGPKIEEFAMRKPYWRVVHCDTSLPAIVAGLNLISQAARMAFSVRP